MKRFCASLVLVIATSSGLSSNSIAATAQSTWDGVYTDEQATRGAAQYIRQCAMCHSQSLSGNNESPALVGRFVPNWAGATIDDLYDFIKSTMPLDRPNTLRPEDYADITAYLLKANGFPSGQSMLVPGESMKAISFDAVPRHPSAPKR